MVLIFVLFYLNSLIVSRHLYADIPPQIINRIFLFDKSFIDLIKIPIDQKLQGLINLLKTDF